MEWIESTRETLRYLEEHLSDDVDLTELAALVSLSPFTLQKSFRIMTGFSIGEYLRNRRLYEAGLALLRSDEKVIDLALRWGYDTPEGFTKAFTRFHGVSPSVLRRGEGELRSFLPLHLQIQITGGGSMNYSIVPMWSMKLIGFERIFSGEDSYETIPKFWDEITEAYWKGIHAGKSPENELEQAIIDNNIGEFGVCIDDLGEGRFRYMIAGRYAGGAVPEGMSLTELPGGTWAKFKAIGPTPESLQRLNSYIFREWLPGNTEYEMSGAWNVEWYNCDMDQNDPDFECGIWLPVRRKNSD